MTRILAVALLCATSSVGCSTMKSSGPLAQRQAAGACHVASSQHAPRPDIQRTACVQPMGVMDIPAGEGRGRGQGLLGHSGHDMVNGCVSCVADCHNGLCGDACGYGPCESGQCGSGQCGSGQYGYGPQPMQCSCGNLGHCTGCQHNRGLAARARALAQRAASGTMQPGMCMTDAAYNFNPGPPTGQTAYPYYTTRGPRDFFLNNPPSIGPY